MLKRILPIGEICSFLSSPTCFDGTCRGSSLVVPDGLRLWVTRCWFTVPVFVVLFVTHVSGAESQPKESLDTTAVATGGADDSNIPEGHSYHGEAFNEGPRQAAELLPGMGNINFETSTKNEQAQAFFNQGVAALHGFWYLEAERSFRQSAKHDPELAMAYWGMAQANTNNEARAREFIDKASKLKPKASKREQLYIDALANYLKKPEKSENNDQKIKRQRRYLEDLERLVDEYPDDIEARAFLALRLWYVRKEIPIVSYQAVNALLSEVFAANSMHPAHHYRIHLWDESKPKHALKSAALCGPSLPGIAHMWHMPGHTYSKLNRYEDAAWQQEASARVDHAHMTRAKLMPDQIHNFAHNNEWLVRNLVFLGCVDEALLQSRNFLTMPRHPDYNSVDKRGSFQFGRMRLLQTLTEFELWEALIQESAQQHFAPVSHESLDDERTAWLVVAHTLTNDLDKARTSARSLKRKRIALESEILDLEEALDELASDKRKKDGRSNEIDKKRRQVEKIESWLALGEAAAAVVKRDAKALQDAVSKTTELDEVLAASWLGQAGDHAGAVERLEKLVSSRPNQVRPLAVLVDQLWKAGKQEDAVKRFETLRGVAGNADVQTPLLERLKPIAEKAGVSGDWRQPKKRASDVGERPELESLGPRFWNSYPALPWTVKSSDDSEITDDLFQGKPKILVFYLGFGCLHCVEQLKAIQPKVDAFKQAGFDVLAISTENVEELKKGIEAYEEKIEVSLFADPSHEVFKAYHCWDDFEDQPLHGTFVIDSSGIVRWQDIGHEPFNDIEFLLEESKRLIATPINPSRH